MNDLLNHFVLVLHWREVRLEVENVVLVVNSLGKRRVKVPRIHSLTRRNYFRNASSCFIADFFQNRVLVDASDVAALFFRPPIQLEANSLECFRNAKHIYYLFQTPARRACGLVWTRVVRAARAARAARASGGSWPDGQSAERERERKRERFARSARSLPPWQGPPEAKRYVPPVGPGRTGSRQREREK